jgi:alpha 1,3-glucosidase
MLMSLNIAGYSFVGADVGGFFKDPEPELLVRWYQAGAYQPFFRGHSHIDTKRREPWLFGDSYTALIRQAIRSRYAMLPYLYTTFHANSAAAAGAMPVMRPMFVHYPEDANLFGVEDQYLLGEDLLVKPVTKPGQTSTTIILPGSQPWYDIDSAQSHIGGQTTTVQTPIHKIPVMQRGGSIVARKERVRRSSKLMAADPYTLVVALDLKGAAKGRLYVDDGASFEFQHGSYAWREFSFENNQFQAKNVATASNVVGSAVVAPASSSFSVPNTIERIVLMGLKSNPTRITLTQGGQSRALEFLSIGGRLVIRKPDVNVLADFTITLA